MFPFFVLAFESGLTWDCKCHLYFSRNKDFWHFNEFNYTHSHINISILLNIEKSENNAVLRELSNLVNLRLREWINIVPGLHIQVVNCSFLLTYVNLDEYLLSNRCQDVAMDCTFNTNVSSDKVCSHIKQII